MDVEGGSSRRYLRLCGIVAAAILAALAVALVALMPVAAGDANPLSLEQGPLVKILDTADLPEGRHYVNDHSLLRLPDGRFLLTGIFHREPSDGRDERAFLHAAAPASEPSQWYASPAPSFRVSPQRFALRAAEDEPWIWAPHLARDHDGSLVMIYHAGALDPDRAAFHLARSRDGGATWIREGGTLFEDFCVARDPKLLRLGALWVVYYTRCDAKASQHSGVAYRISPDLHRWSAPSMALTLPVTRFDSGHTESPFVFHRRGWFYLTVTSYPVAWDATFVYRSRSPFHFPPEPIARLQAHAAEWVAEGEDFENGRLFFTHAGPGAGGVWMGELFGL
jgi:hypothetical protein